MSNFLSSAHPLFFLGILLLAAYIGGRTARLLGMPRISGYIVAGMLLSPSITGLLPEDVIMSRLSVVTDMALSVIAFSIGGALEISRIRRLGKSILLITLFEATAAFIVVSLFVGLLLPLVHHSVAGTGTVWAIAVLLGAICAATAPAAVLGIVQEYRSRGPVTTVLLGVVTLDDALAIALFSLAGGIAGGLEGGEAPMIASVILEPLGEVVLSVAIGAAAGGLLRLFIPVARRKASLLGIGLGAVFTTAGMALTLHGSSLLACMVLGFTLVNAVAHPEQWFEAVETVEEPIFGMFFVLAGAHLRLEALTAAGWLTSIIIVGRSLAKIAGSYAGSVLSGAPAVVRKNLPLGLLPQAGVSIGLVLAATEIMGYPEAVEIMVNAVLASVVINELLSPPLVRYALVKAGEIEIEGEVR